MESGDYGEKSLVDPMERKYNKCNTFMTAPDALTWNLASPNASLPPKAKQSKFPDKKPGGLSIGLMGGMGMEMNSGIHMKSR